VSVPARRLQVAYSRERGLSVRRACTLFRVARSALRYASRKAAADAPVIDRMKALSAQYPRYGYRRIRIFLGRDGHCMSVGRAYRLWQAAGVSSRSGSFGLGRLLFGNALKRRTKRLPTGTGRSRQGRATLRCLPRYQSATPRALTRFGGRHRDR
jgi:hypothetical protein